jgi:hypothetical protein
MAVVFSKFLADRQFLMHLRFTAVGMLDSTLLASHSRLIESFFFLFLTAGSNRPSNVRVTLLDFGMQPILSLRLQLYRVEISSNENAF